MPILEKCRFLSGEWGAKATRTGNHTSVHDMIPQSASGGSTEGGGIFFMQQHEPFLP